MVQPSTALNEAKPIGHIAILFCIITLTSSLLTYEAWHTGVTADEPGHLVSSRLYWQHADRLRPQDMPPLIKIAAGWVPRLMDLPLPPDLGKLGEDRREWEVAINMMERLKPSRIQGIFFWSRLPLTLFPLLTITLIWFWSRQIFSPAIALFLAAAFAIEPTALGHGALFKNDHAATFTHLLFWYCVWRYWKTPTLRSAMLAGLVAALAILSKLSLLFVIPLLPLLLFARRPGWRALGWTFAAMSACYCLLIATYQFDARVLTTLEIQEAAASQYVPRTFVAIAGIFRALPIPPSIWTGIITLLSNTSFEMPVYLFGKVWPEGNPFYFVQALAVKVPVSIWILLILGSALTASRVWKRSLPGANLFWILPGFLYIALASRVPLQLGVRLILPALPFGLLICGVALEWLMKHPARKVALPCFAAMLIIESAAIYPHGIGFFNFASGGPNSGSRYLTDSNLDWGQGLGDLASYTRRNHLSRVKLSYFGNDMTYRYFGHDEVEVIAPPWSESLVTSDRLIPEPGAWYAISPTLLPGQFFAPRFKDYYAAFRTLEPVARPGYSIFVYHIESGPK